MLRNYFKTAWRNLVKNRVYSFINITGLALGLACTILIGLWVNDEIQFDKFHEHGPQLYRVLANTFWCDEATGEYVPANLNAVIKKDIPGIKYVATIGNDEILFSVGENRNKEKGCYATEDFLKMFSFPLAAGDINTALSSQKNVVISQNLADKYFKGIDPIGKTITINNADAFSVSAVLKKLPANSSLQFDWLIPFDFFEAKNDWLKKWGSYSSFIYVMLSRNTALADVNDKLKHILAKYAGGSKDEIFMQPFTDKYLYADFKAGKQEGGRIVYVRLFSVIALFILLIACINFMNLTTARSVKRAKEVGIRKVIGAEKKMLVVQFYGEALLLTICAVLLSLIVVTLLLPAFNQLTGKQLHPDFLHPGFIMAILAVTAITGLVAGSYPALFLSSFKPIVVLKNISSKSPGANFLRKSLVIFQFALSIMLIIGTIIIYNQIHFIKNKNLGLDRENLVLMPIAGEIYNHLDVFKGELSKSPGIVNVSSGDDVPIDINGTSADLNWPGKDPKSVVSVNATWVAYNYLNTMHIPLVTGRDFSKDRADSNKYIINESAARLMKLKDPIGQPMEFWNGRGTIIGVVKDFHLHSLHQPITPLILCLQPKNASTLYVRTEKGKTQQALSSLQSLYKKYEASYPFEYHFLDDMYEEKYKSETMVGKLVNIFALMAIFISCLGLFGLATYTAEQRIKEIGIRKVLGASVTSITGLLTKDFLKLVFISAIIAFPAAWFAMNNWLNNYAYRTTISWWIFVAAGVLAVLIALITVGYQAIKAALTNPVKNLRTE